MISVNGSPFGPIPKLSYDTGAFFKCGDDTSSEWEPWMVDSRLLVNCSAAIAMN